MRFFLHIIMALLLVSCESIEVNKTKYSHEHTQKNNSVLHNTGSSDSCCAHWTAGGKCAHELVPGCSKR